MMTITWNNNKMILNSCILKPEWLRFMFMPFLLFFNDSFSQIPLNTWRTHFSYRSIQGLEMVENQAYGFSKSGFFYVNIINNQTTLFSKQDGLSETNVGAMSYLATTKQLLIGYESGNIDLVNIKEDGKPRGVSNIALIKDAGQIVGSKRINQITVKNNDALLATDFGIIRFDIARSEIKETYQNIGKDGSKVAVLSLAFATDSVVALTNSGLLAARFSSAVNLQYFANWKPISPPENNTISQIVTLNATLFASVGNRLWSYEKGKWTLLQTHMSPISSLSIINNQVVVSIDDKLIFIGGNTLTNPLFKNTNALKVSSDGSIWLATSQNGLVRFQNNMATGIQPNGPLFDNYKKLSAFQSQVVAINPSLVGFDIFASEKWTAAASPQSVVAVTQTLDKKLIAASQNTLYIFSNSLEKIAGSFQNISGLSTDKSGNLWITTSSTNFSTPNLYLRRTDGTIQPFSLPRRQLLAILIDDNDYKWFRVGDAEGGGILVFDDRNNRTKVLNTGQNSGNLPSSTINDFVKDKDGTIWVGTDKGIAVFDNPSAIFSTNIINAYTPVFERRKLLANESITSIAIDGGSNKWIGTNNGLFRFSLDGTSLLEKFSENDSPLISNQILDIAIEPTGGEVFVATPRGIVSYRAAASELEATLSKITIFPNPVRPEFNGTVGISGLVENAVVKITELSGKLVFETRSSGGTASWNLVDYQGRRPETGIYLVLVADANGQESLAGKLAIVR